MRPEITRRRHTMLIQRGPILFTAEGTAEEAVKDHAEEHGKK
jgi:hypothetical protein